VSRPATRRICALVAGLGAALAPSTATATLKVRWDCYLPGTSLDCVVVENSLTSKIPFLRLVRDRADADVLITVTSLPAENATRFKLDFVGKRVDGYRIEVHTTDKIPASIDATTALVRIMTKLERGLDDFMDQKIAAGMSDGKLTLELLDPVRLPYTGRPEQHSLSWYVTPSVGSYLSDVEGVGVNASANAGVSLNYSATSWRLQQSIGVSYSRQSQPVPGTPETASISFTGGNATNVLTSAITRDNHWSAGLLFAAEKNPQANYTMRANASVGLELDLVPRQTVNQKNLGFRCAVGPEFQRYDATNVEGMGRQLLARQFCDVFLSWHFDPADVWASVGETSILDNVAYRSFSASLSLVWRVTDNLAVSPWINLQQVNRATNEARPTTAVYSDPKKEIEASMLAAVQQGYTAPFGVQTGLSIKYFFGNGSLASEDQRWKNASNLR
jgi:hypothetical protein